MKIVGLFFLKKGQILRLSTLETENFVNFAPGSYGTDKSVVLRGLRFSKKHVVFLKSGSDSSEATDLDPQLWRGVVLPLYDFPNFTVP